jgi:hypothetical protein
LENLGRESEKGNKCPSGTTNLGFNVFEIAESHIEIFQNPVHFLTEFGVEVPCYALLLNIIEEMGMRVGLRKVEAFVQVDGIIGLSMRIQRAWSVMAILIGKTVTFRRPLNWRSSARPAARVFSVWHRREAYMSSLR